MSRNEFVNAVGDQAWDVGKDCPTCKGDGKVYPGRDCACGLHVGQVRR